MDNSLGTWKLNLGKSQYTPAPFPVKNLTTKREVSAGGVKVTTTGVQADDSAINTVSTVQYDGKEYPVTGGGPFDTVSTKQVDDNTFTATLRKASGPFNATGRTVISKDGKTMTATVSGTGADGKPFNATLVYDKQ